MVKKYPSAPERQEAIQMVLGANNRLRLDQLASAVTRYTGSAHMIPEGYIRWDIQQIRRNRLPGEPALVVSPRGYEWLYELTDDPDKIRAWLDTREGDTDSRVVTMLSQADAAVDLTPSTSKAHRRARLEQMHLGRLKQDIEVLEEAMANGS